MKKIIKFELENNEVANKFTQMGEATKHLGQIPNVTFEEVFTPTFMRENTEYESLIQFIKASGLGIKTEEDLTRNSRLDAYILANSCFKCWGEMYETAAREYLSNKLKF